jgi:hypothetical protein
LFKDWRNCGDEVLENFRRTLHTKEFIEYCSLYEQFPWSKGEELMREITQKREEFVRSWKAELDSLNVSSLSFKSALESSTNFDSQHLNITNL